MEQRLPSVPSLQSDLLITHGAGGFISLVMQIVRWDKYVRAHTHPHTREGIIWYRGMFVFPMCDVELCDSKQAYLNEHLKDRMIDGLLKSKQRRHQKWMTSNEIR